MRVDYSILVLTICGACAHKLYPRGNDDGNISYSISDEYTEEDDSEYYLEPEDFYYGTSDDESPLVPLRFRPSEERNRLESDEQVHPPRKRPTPQKGERARRSSRKVQRIGTLKSGSRKKKEKRTFKARKGKRHSSHSSSSSYSSCSSSSSSSSDNYPRAKSNKRGEKRSLKPTKIKDLRKGIPKANRKRSTNKSTRIQRLYK